MSGSPVPPDVFALFELTPTFQLDAAALEERFFARSRELHPDRFVSAPAAQRVAALSRSRALNDAYQVLRKPVARAEYLLGRYGVTIGGNERLAPEFLQEILELREELAEARVAKRMTEVSRLAAAMRARRKAAVDALGPLFAEIAPVPEIAPTAVPAASAPVLERLKQQLIALRYLDRYLEECEAALDSDLE